MSQVAQGSRPVPAPQDPLAGKNYRVRGMFVVLDIDIYDDAGMRIDTARTAEIMVPEAVIPRELARALGERLSMTRGFAILQDPPAAE